MCTLRRGLLLMYLSCLFTCSGTGYLAPPLLEDGVVIMRNQCNDCNVYQRELRRRLDNGMSVSVKQFNELFHRLNQCYELSDHMLTRHIVYQWMIEAGSIPDVRTFNYLFRGIRYTRPVQFQFISYFLDEMVKFNVFWNSVTIEEMLTLCAMHPDPNNVQTADSWFYDVYMKREWRSPTPYVNHMVAFAYANVYAAAGDVEGAIQIKEWVIAHYGHRWSAKTKKAFNRLFRRAFQENDL